MKILKNLNWNPGFVNSKGQEIQYEKKWYCTEKKEIHGSQKEFLKCKHCVSELDKLEYEALKRLEWFLNGYFIHNLSSDFSKISTERICETYNIKLNYFKPWI